MKWKLFFITLIFFFLPACPFTKSPTKACMLECLEKMARNPLTTAECDNEATSEEAYKACLKRIGFAEKVQAMCEEECSK